jgi:predicted RNA-binding Zn-ribbon protein involved in translation (DUF1610 family)
MTQREAAGYWAQFAAAALQGLWACAEDELGELVKQDGFVSSSADEADMLLKAMQSRFPLDAEPVAAKEDQLPCPACGSVEIANYSDDDDHEYVGCDDCKLRGPAGVSEKDADRRWSLLPRAGVKS